MVLVDKTYMEEIKSWYDQRSICFNYDVLPKFGLIVPGIAAGFMYITDDNRIALLEGFVTNPKAGMKAKDKAITDLTDMLVLIAQGKKVKHVFGLTDTKSIVNKSKTLGFKEVGNYTLIYQEL